MANTNETEQSNQLPPYLSEGRYHAAGFDSFVTMKVFLKLAGRMDAAIRMKEGRKTTETPATKAKNKKRKPRSKPSEDLAGGTFFDANPFENLPQNDEDADVPLGENNKQMDGAPVDATTMHPSSETPISSSRAINRNDGVVDVTAMAKPVIWASHLIPAWENIFWKAYGNKLRVYGTQEEVCDLTMIAKARSSSEQTSPSQEGSGQGPVRRRSWLQALLRPFS